MHTTLFSFPRKPSSPTFSHPTTSLNLIHNPHHFIIPYTSYPLHLPTLSTMFMIVILLPTIKLWLDPAICTHPDLAYTALSAVLTTLWSMNPFHLLMIPCLVLAYMDTHWLMLTGHLINQIERVFQGTSSIFFVHLFPGPLSNRRWSPSPLLSLSTWWWCMPWRRHCGYNCSSLMSTYPCLIHSQSFVIMLVLWILQTPTPPPHILNTLISPYHFICECLASSSFSTSWVPTADMSSSAAMA